jgi:DNA polymerase bacteriophage-type
MRELQIDIETYSPVGLKKSGVFPYCHHPDFEILLFGYAYGSDPVKVVDLASGEKIPETVIQDLYRDSILKTAFNAAFEIACLNSYLIRHGWLNLKVEQWECTMVKAAMLGLPLSLAKVAEVLRIPQQKMAIGGTLIRYFCVPCKPTAVNGGRTRNRFHHDPAKWATFVKYCGQDVYTERGIRNKISFFEIPEKEKRMWNLDQSINTRGVLIDKTFVENAIHMDAEVKKVLYAKAIILTGLSNPNSGAQLKTWLEQETDEEVTSLTKKTVPLMLRKYPEGIVNQVLAIRQELSKTSIRKYQAMINAVGHDDRIRGLTQYYGANRTGRWAGRFVQMQNLPQNHLKLLEEVRQLVLEGDLVTLEWVFGNVPDTLSQLIRTAFIASAGKLLYVADFSAIEARIIAWLAGEQWRLMVFATHGKIYEASASKMFKVPIEEVTKGSPLRQKGKVSELALGYQGGAGALETMGALQMGIDKEELPILVEQWRTANPAIVQLWTTMNRAAINCLSTGEKTIVAKGVYFEYANNILYMVLPSGRRLCYVRPRLGKNRFGSTAITYEGMDQDTKKWGTLETYGGKLVENCVQAIARDCLAESMLKLNAEGFDIVFHVHDEVVIEEDQAEPEAYLNTITDIMGEDIPWAPGLMLRADGYYTPYYKKD